MAESFQDRLNPGWTIDKPGASDPNDPGLTRQWSLRNWWRTLPVFPAIAAVLVIAGCAHREKTADVYPYHNPLTSPGAKFAGLPPAVQNTIHAQAGTAEIYDIQKMSNPERIVYKILFRDSAQYPPLYVAADGSVLYPNMNVAVGAAEDSIGVITSGPVTGIKMADVPNAVAKTVQEKAPTAEVAYINKIGTGEKAVYEIAFKDGMRNPKLYVAEDGRLLRNP